MILSQLAVVFVGIVGNHHETVERQLAPTLDKVGVSEVVIPDADLSAIVTHAKSSRALVKKMHVGGVIAGQLLARGRTRTFRVVIYDAEGNLSSETESPVSAAGLEKVDLDVLAINVGELTGGARPAKRAPAPAPTSSSHVDDDVPPGVGSAPAKHDAPAKPVALADDSDPVATSPAVEQHAPTSGGGVHVEIGLALGVVGRSLSTDPNTVKYYSSSPVGTGGFEGAVEVGAKLRISGLFEHTLVMHSDVAPGNASSAIGRYQIAVAYDVVHNDSVQLAPMLGLGARYFSIDSTSTTRTPDEQYTYVLLGGTVTKSLGTRWVLRGLAAFEPVVGGVEPKMATSASRWGFDLGAELEVRATAHVFARAAFDYQSFASSWSMVGGMTDAYSSGTVAAGATF
jgi:opacity protein-like surface antigen